jgi:hypothetical protein
MRTTTHMVDDNYDLSVFAGTTIESARLCLSFFLTPTVEV